MNNTERSSLRVIMHSIRVEEKEKGRLHVWTKRLGHRHYARECMNTTICGVPMLGDNYVNTISDSKQKECEKCVIILECECEENVKYL